jgi:hypothetical protein
MSHLLLNIIIALTVLIVIFWAIFFGIGVVIGVIGMIFKSIFYSVFTAIGWLIGSSFRFIRNKILDKKYPDQGAYYIDFGPKNRKGKFKINYKSIR